MSGDAVATADAEPTTDADATVAHDADVVTGEIVTDDTPTALEVAPPPDTRAIDQLAHDALMPGVAGRDEFISLAMQARILSMSGAAPKAVRDNPHLALHMAMVGRDLGISPSAALELIDPIGEGDKTRLSLSPQLLAGQVRRLGLGTIERGPLTSTSCTAFAVEPGGRLDKRCQRLGEHWVSEDGYAECNCEGVLGFTTFTWEDAQIAGLVNKKCTSPTDHNCANLDWKQKCKQGWKAYPKRMLWWRACGYCVDDYFPEAGLGLYTPEELGAMVDDEGRAIDPTTVELPEGYEPAGSHNEPPPPQASEEMHAELARKIGVLSDADKATLRAQWEAERIPPLKHGLSVREMGRANTLVYDLTVAAHEAAKVVDADEVAASFGATTEPEGATDAQAATENAPSVPQGAADDEVGHDLPDEFRDALVGIPAHVFDTAAKTAQMLPLKGVDESLKSKGLPRTGNADTRRARLAVAMAREAVSDDTVGGDEPF